MIRMPLIKDEIRAACRTEEELEIEITAQLKEYVREPQVTVQIQQYQSEPVAVLGSVRAPSRFLLQRRVRLLELLTFVNGPTENAGRTIQVVHTESSTACKNSSSLQPGSEEKPADQIDYYSLKDTLRGEEQSNPIRASGRRHLDCCGGSGLCDWQRGSSDINRPHRTNDGLASHSHGWWAGSRYQEERNSYH